MLIYYVKPIIAQECKEQYLVFFMTLEETIFVPVSGAPMIIAWSSLSFEENNFDCFLRFFAYFFAVLFFFFYVNYVVPRILIRVVERNFQAQIVGDADN